MFNNIDKKKFKLLFVWKYFFQLILAPIIMAFFMLAVCFVVAVLCVNFEQATIGFNEQMTLLFVTGKVWIVFVVTWSLVFLLFNILSVVPFVKVVIDALSRNDSETKEIVVSKVFFPYELQCLRQSKRFLCDTFLCLTNCEIFVYDENKRKYRLFWNANYGIGDDVELLICRAKRMRISYYKYSRIIYRKL